MEYLLHAKYNSKFFIQDYGFNFLFSWISLT